MNVEKYRKKPVVIEAFKLENDRQSIIDAIEFVHKIGTETSEDLLNSTVKMVQTTGGFTIPTLEGTMFANFGDFIIKGVQGEFYPCKPDIFEATYEKVEI